MPSDCPGPPRFVTAPDGVRLAYRELGDGPAVVLLHGFFSSGVAGWLKPGHAQRLAGAGRRVIVCDLRGHGRSDRPTGPDAYRPDGLVDDVLAVVDALGLERFAAAGYSLGSRIVARLMLRGAAVERAVLGGQGLATMSSVPGRSRGGFLAPLLRDDPPRPDELTTAQRWFVAQWNRRAEDERAALRRLLLSSLPTPAAQLRAITVPTLVVTGSEDGPVDGRALASAFGNGVFAEVPGDHIRAAGRPTFGDQLVGFLQARTNS
ncbi:alpha/beta fold hydrolase [Jatrophihabitans fulvus]